MDNRFFLHQGEFKILPHPHYSSYSSFPLHPTIEQVVLYDFFVLEHFRSLFPPFPIHSFPFHSSSTPIRSCSFLSPNPFSFPHDLRSSSLFVGCSSRQARGSQSFRPHLFRVCSARATPSEFRSRSSFCNHTGRSGADSAAQTSLFGADRRGGGRGIA